MVIRDHLKEKLAGVSFAEQAPSKATVKELQNKVPAAPFNCKVQ